MENINSQAFTELENSVHSALETYSNVHRGSGHFSMVTTHLYDKAREIVLDHLSLDKSKYVLIFCTPRRETMLKALLNEGSFRSISSEDIGLHLGVRALAVKKSDLPAGISFEPGGGTTRLVSRDWIMWAHAPERFEAGTPAVINTIAFASALLLTGRYGTDVFRNLIPAKTEVSEIIYHDELENYSGHELLSKLRETLIGRNVPVPTAAGRMNYVNLDNAASTSSLGPVWDTFCKTLLQPPQRHQEIVNEVKSLCCKFLGAPEDKYEVIFTSNTTEGINIVAKSLAKEPFRDSEPVVLNTLLEHNSNDLPWRNVPKSTLIRLPVDGEGFINTNELESIMAAYNGEGKFGRIRIRLAAVSGASNVLGSFNDLAEISRIAHKYGAQLLVDGAQLVAHRKVDAENLGIDCLVFCAHKAYAPFGTGVLLVKKGLLNLSPDEIRQINASGEENIGGIAALGKALVLLERTGMDIIRDEERRLTQEALTGFSGIKGLSIYGIREAHSPRFEQKGGVIAFIMKGKISTTIARELADRGGIGIRSGCHCAHLLVKKLVNVPPFFEEVQRVLGLVFTGIVFPGIARISLGIGSTKEDLDRLFKVLGDISSHGLSQTQTGSESDRKTRISRKDLQKLLDEFRSEAVRKVYFHQD